MANIYSNQVSTFSLAQAIGVLSALCCALNELLSVIERANALLSEMVAVKAEEIVEKSSENTAVFNLGLLFSFVFFGCIFYFAVTSHSDISKSSADCVLKTALPDSLIAQSSENNLFLTNQVIEAAKGDSELLITVFEVVSNLQDLYTVSEKLTGEQAERFDMLLRYVEAYPLVIV